MRALTNSSIVHIIISSVIQLFIFHHLCLDYFSHYFLLHSEAVDFRMLLNIILLCNFTIWLFALLK